jgi:hypothetical protein
VRQSYSFEEVEIIVIINSRVERDVERVVLALSVTDVLDISSPWEEVAEPVEGDSHDSVSAVESLFDSVSMMDVDVDVEHAVVVLEQFKDGEHDVVNVAEAAGFHLLGVVKAACPVDANVRALVVQLDGRIQ